MRIAFTGHRPPQVNYTLTRGEAYREDTDRVQWVKACLKDVVEAYDAQFITGGALGVDTWAAEEVLRQGKDLTVYAPCRDQESRWPEHAQKRYQRIAAQAKVVYIQDQFDMGCMQKRNEAMVRDCHRLIAVWRHIAGGTRGTIAYALVMGRPITLIDLEKYTIIPNMKEEDYYVHSGY